MFKNLFCIIIVIIFALQSLIIRKQAIFLKQSNNAVEQMNQQIKTLKQNYLNNWRFERSRLNIDEIYDENEQNANVFFSISDQPVLLFRFFISNCAPCDINQTNILKEVQNSSLKYRLICNRLENKQGLFTFKRMNRISETVYSSKKLIDGEPVAMYFCIYYQGVVSDVFFPDENFSDLTKNYLKKISTKYFTVK